jgi:hypothetical protein
MIVASAIGIGANRGSASLSPGRIIKPREDAEVIC